LSVYVKSRFRDKGIGKKLITEVLALGKELGLHTVLSRITVGNESSIHLHKVLGFKDVGTMREVGVKFGRLLDVRIMQLMY
jgi:L-amino acid N-acyltransferase